jgi:hypothetical protein
LARAGAGISYSISVLMGLIQSPVDEPSIVE